VFSADLLAGSGQQIAAARAFDQIVPVSIKKVLVLFFNPGY
jgi:hypothetical protein